MGKHIGKIFKKIFNIIIIFSIILDLGSKVKALQPTVQTNDQTASIACAPGEVIPDNTVSNIKPINTQVHDKEWRLQQIYLFCFEYHKIFTDVMKDYTDDYITDYIKSL